MLLRAAAVGSRWPFLFVGAGWGGVFGNETHFPHRRAETMVLVAVIAVVGRRLSVRRRILIWLIGRRLRPRLARPGWKIRRLWARNIWHEVSASLVKVVGTVKVKGFPGDARVTCKALFPMTGKVNLLVPMVSLLKVWAKTDVDGLLFAFGQLLPFVTHYAMPLGCPLPTK